MKNHRTLFLILMSFILAVAMVISLSTIARASYMQYEVSIIAEGDTKIISSVGATYQYITNNKKLEYYKKWYMEDTTDLWFKLF
jgi:hypothetical protein